MKTPTPLPACTRRGFPWSTALAAAAVLVGCSGAAAKSSLAKPLVADSTLHAVNPGAEWPAHHRRHPELGKCLVTPDTQTNAGEGDSPGAEVSSVDDSTLSERGISGFDAPAFCGGARTER